MYSNSNYDLVYTYVDLRDLANRHGVVKTYQDVGTIYNMIKAPFYDRKEFYYINDPFEMVRITQGLEASVEKAKEKIKYLALSYGHDADKFIRSVNRICSCFYAEEINGLQENKHKPLGKMLGMLAVFDLLFKNAYPSSVREAYRYRNAMNDLDLCCYSSGIYMDRIDYDKIPKQYQAKDFSLAM